jgi:hypothetical protein
MARSEQQAGASWLWRSRWAAIGAALTVAVGGGGLFVANAASGPASTVVTIDPVRILDTRDPLNVGLAGPFVSAVSQKLQVTGPVPTTTGNQTAVPIGATGVLLNVTVVGATANGFLSVRPGDATGAPSTSSLNFSAGDIVPNSVQVGLPTVGANAGQIDITYDAFGTAGPTTDVLVDVVGYTTQLDAYTRAETDAAIGGSVQQTITAGGVSGVFTLPPAQLTLGSQTITTSKAGHLELHFAGAGGLNCTGDGITTYYAWIEVNGVPVRSSAVRIGENFSVPTADSFSATNFSQKVLHGVTATPVAAGVHQVRARFGCTSGSNLGSSSGAYSWIVTVLSGTPQVAALELDPSEASDPAKMCVVDADGLETCTTE